MATTAQTIPIYFVENLHSTENNPTRKLGPRNRSRARSKVRAFPPPCYLAHAPLSVGLLKSLRLARARLIGPERARRGWAVHDCLVTAAGLDGRADERTWWRERRKTKRQPTTTKRRRGAWEEKWTTCFFVQSQIWASLSLLKLISRWRGRSITSQSLFSKLLGQ